MNRPREVTAKLLRIDQAKQEQAEASLGSLLLAILIAVVGLFVGTLLALCLEALWSR